MNFKSKVITFGKMVFLNQHLRVLVSVLYGVKLSKICEKEKCPRRGDKLLIEAGYLEVVDDVKLPTDRGQGIGITTVERYSNRGKYIQCLFGADAQRVCAELIFE